MFLKNCQWKQLILYDFWKIDEAHYSHSGLFGELSVWLPEEVS